MQAPTTYQPTLPLQGHNFAHLNTASNSNVVPKKFITKNIVAEFNIR